MNNSAKNPVNTVCIAGAGAIGNYLGIQLYKAGFTVNFLASPRVSNAIEKNGLELQYPDGALDRFPAGSLAFSSDPSLCASADLVLVTCKSQATETIAQDIKPHLSPTAVVLTLQNGISNLDALKAQLPQQRIEAGMVTLNAVELSPSTFRLTTHGDIHLQRTPDSPAVVFRQAGLIVNEHTDLHAALWSKLLLNLINPLNALSRQSLKTNLADRQFRLQWAACMREGLAVLNAAGIKPARITPLPPHLLPFMVSLPDWIYLRLANNMTDMDATAKSSMAQDIDKGRATEIDFLSGEIIRLGQRVGVPTPDNEQIYQKIRQLESGRAT